MKRLYVALGLSLIFHFIQISLVSLAPNLKTQFNQNQTSIELVENPQKQQPENEKKILPIPKVNSVANQQPARFFSENDQRVAQETATKNLGVTRNQNLSSAELKKTKPTKIFNTDDEPEFAKSIHQQTEVSAPSALPFKLPNDIAEGSATNLNTDAHIYASFYNRVTELFYIRWIQRLDAIWSRLSQEDKQNLSGRVWQTDIEVWLKSTGEYHRSFIMKPSGYQNFDNAAVFAFQNAKFFPNPPKAKVEPDGFIRLRYRIAVHVR
jgi:TonB family protein